MNPILVVPKSVRSLALSLLVLFQLGGCGSSNDSSGVRDVRPAEIPGGVPLGGVTLKPPVLSFNDTGINVSDGVTRNGLWQVSTTLDWEYSLDQGATWIRGSGDSFEVLGDGAKTIWVRARDDQGNTSEIVMVTCVLDTNAPNGVMVTPSTAGFTRSFAVSGVEAQGRWEYSVDDQATWLPGTGPRLAVLGNAVPVLWFRQVDLAGNPSVAQRVSLDMPMNDAWHESSGDPLRPSEADFGQARTLLLHGLVVRGDADYVHWNVPAGTRVQSVRLVRYVSEDRVAFYAIQRSAVFDAGVDISRMLAYGHMGPEDLFKNVLSEVISESRGPGPMTLWFQQTGPLPTEYVIEVVLE